MRHTFLIAFALLFPLVLTAEKRQKVWQDGTLKDVSLERGSRTVGGVNNGVGTIHSVRDDVTYYTIETPEYTYVAKRTLRSSRDKQLDVTINDPVKFAIDRDDFYLLDSKEKEHKLTLEKKVRNVPASAQGH